MRHQQPISILTFNLSQSGVQVIPWTLCLAQVSVTQEGEARAYVAIRHSGLQQPLGGRYGCSTGRGVWNQKEPNIIKTAQKQQQTQEVLGSVANFHSEK